MPSTPGTVNFPASLDDAVSLIEATNNASSTLTAGINASALSIPVADPGEFSGSGIATLTDSLTAPTKFELVIYTSKSGSNLIVPAGGRGAFGTTAQAWLSGEFIELRPLAHHHATNANAIIAVETYLLALKSKWIFGETPTGAVDGSNATFQSAFDFVPESVAVLVNGVEQRRVTDFNTSGTQTIILMDAPGAGEAVRVNYIIP